MSDEIRTTSATGGMKGTKTADFSQLPPEVMWELAEHFGKGEAKYGRDNWRRGYEWTKNVAALGRHLALWQQGEDIDPETGSHHLNAVIWHAVVLRYFTMHARYDQYNDVQPKPQQPTQETLAEMLQPDLPPKQGGFRNKPVNEFKVSEVDPPNEKWTIYQAKNGGWLYLDDRGGVHTMMGTYQQAIEQMLSHRIHVKQQSTPAANGNWGEENQPTYTQTVIQDFVGTEWISG